MAREGNEEGGKRFLEREERKRKGWERESRGKKLRKGKGL